MGASRLGPSRTITSLVCVVLVLSTLGVDAALGRAAGAVEPPPNLCDGAVACVLDDDGKGPPVLWEGNTTTLTVAVAEPIEKPRPLRLIVGPADGRADRIRRFHRFDITPQVGGNENGLPDEFLVTVPLGAQAVTFDVVLKGDEELEADEWFDLLILDDTDPSRPVGLGHTGVAVIDTTPARHVEVGLRTDTLPEGEAHFVNLRYTGPAEVADVTLVATDPSTPGELAHGRTTQFDPPAVRVERDVVQTVELTIDDDGLDQPDAPMVVVAFAYPADLGLDQPEPVAPEVGGRARPVHGSSEPLTVTDPPPPPPPPAHVSIGDVRALESAGVATLTVARSGNLAPALHLPITYTDGTAQAGLDYATPAQGAPTTVAIPAGATQATVAVPLFDDDAYEGDETFTVHLGAGVGVIVDRSSATVTIDDEDDRPTEEPPPEDEAPDLLRDGIGHWFDLLGGWHDAFRVPDLPIPPPGDDPFDLEELLGALPRPDLDEGADALEDAVDDLAGARCPVEFVVGGIGGAPEPTGEGDIVQVRCTWTVTEPVAGEWSGPLSALPAGFGDLFAEGLDLDLTWAAGSLEIVLVAGVDAEGFYLLGPSGVALRDVGGLGQLAGEGSVLGEGAELSGTATAQLDLHATLAGPDQRVRAEELADMVPAEVGTRVVGSVDLDVAATVGGTDLAWSGRWVAPADGPPGVVTEQEVTLRQQIPGLVVDDPDDPDGPEDAVLELRGTYGTCSEVPGWELDGSLTASGPMALGGFTIAEAAGQGCITGEGLDLQVTAALVLGDPDDPEGGQVDLVLEVDPHGWEAQLDATVPELRAGPVVISDVTLDVDAAHRDGALSFAVVATAAAASIVGPDGAELAVLEGIAVELRGSGQLSLSVEEMEADIAGGALELTADDVTLEVPSTDGTILRADEAEGLAPELGDGLTVTITGLVLYADGRFSAQTASVVQPAGIARSIGLGGLIPFDVTALRLDFTAQHPDGAVDDLSQFEVALDGEIDVERLAGLPFDPIIGLGGPAGQPCAVPTEGITAGTPLVDRQLSLRAAVRVTGSGAIEATPVDLGPVILGLRNLRVGALTFSAVVCAEGYADGVLQPGFGGSARIEGGFDAIDGALTADIGGTFVTGPHGVEVHADATVGFSLAQGGGIELRDLTTRLGLELGFDAEGMPFLRAELAEVALGSASLPFGPFADLALTDATLDLDPEEGGTVFAIGGSLSEPGSGASIAFRDGLAMLDGWGGRVGGLAIDTDFGLRITDGFFVDITVPEGEKFGLPDFLPFEIHRIGLALPEGIEAGDPLTDILSDMVLSVSGGLAGTVAFPVSASVDALTVDLGKLAAYRPLEHGFDPAHFPVGLDGLRFAIEPSLQLGSASVSGELSFGTVTVEGTDGPQEVLYGHISGGLRTPVLEAGADVVISQYGPVLLRVTAPAGVPLGQTGLVLMSVTGAAAFGDVEIPVDPGHPEQLLAGLDDLPTNVSLDEATIAERIAGAVTAGRPTWEDGFALGLAGQLTHVATAGMISGTVTAAVNVRPDGGPQFIAAGEIEVFGIPLSVGEAGGSLAVAGMLLDLEDPLAPSLSFAFQAPTPGSPLALLFPVQASAEAELRTDGVVEGLVVGTQAAFGSLAGSALTGIARHLDGDRANPLSRLLLDTDGDGAVSADEGDRTVTAGLLTSRLDALFSAGRGGEVFGSLVVALGAYVETLDATAGAQLLADFFAALADSAEAALRAAGDVFDPSLLVRARIQTALFGIPIGDPAQEVELILDRSSFGFTTSSSVMSTLSRQVTGLDVLGPVLSDQLTFGVQVPIPNMVDVLFGHDEVEGLDAEDSGQSWSITIAGSITVNGLTAEVGGFMTGPGNRAFVDARVQPRWECYDPGPVPESCTESPDPDRVQFSRQVDYDNLLAHGGLVLHGALEVPRLLTDPVDVVSELPDLPSNPLDALGWFDDFAATIGQVDKPVQAVVLIPGLPEADSGPEVLDAWLDAVSVTGVYEGTRQTPDSEPVARLLSVPIGQGRMVATREGVEVSAHIPLLGARGTFVARVDEVVHEGRTVAVPAGKLELSLSTAELQAALAGLGLPEIFEVSSVEGGAGVRAYTPGFDPDGADPLARTGGLALTAGLDAAGFVAGAEVEVAVDLGGDGFGPDFRATAAVDRLGPFGDITVTDAELVVAKVGPAVTVEVTGAAQVLGSRWTVRGHLGPDLTGRLELEGSGDEAPDFAGFSFVSGGVVIELARQGGTLVGSVGIGGVVALPDWLTDRAEVSTVAAAGCLASDGRAELRLALGRIQLAPGGFYLTGTGAPLPNLGGAACTLPAMPEMDDDDARLVIRTNGGTTTVAADGAVQVPGIGTLSASGSVSGAGRFELATSSFTIGSATGARLEVPATRFVSEAGGAGFRLQVPGATRVVIPGMADGEPGRPTLTISRAFDIDTTASRFVLFDATGSRVVDLGLLRVSGRLVLERVDGAFRLSLEGRSASQPAYVDLGVLGRVELPTVYFGSDGSFDVAIAIRRLGPESPRFALAGSSLRLRNQGGVLGLAFQGGTLELPGLPAPIPLGDLSMQGRTTFTRDVTVPAIALGPAFRTTGSARFRISVGRGEASFTLLDTGARGPRMEALAGSANMRLETFRASTAGTFSGRVRGQLRVAGARLASGTFDLRLSQGLLELRLSTPGLHVNWGFGQVRVTGWARSDGRYDFTGSLSSHGSIAGVLTWSGSATMRARTSGLTGRFVGQVTMRLLGASVRSSVNLGVDAVGQVDGRATFRVQVCLGTLCYLENQTHDVSFRLGSSSLPPDTTRPAMAQPPDVEVFTSKTSGTIPVQFAHPVADDARDGPILAVCNPASGSSFQVRRSTSVSCTATDAAGNSRTRTFQVHVRDSNMTFDQDGAQLSTGVGGLLGGTVVRGFVMSTPVEVFRGTVAGDGTAVVRFTVPSGIEPGLHHLVISGTGADGDPRQWVVPLTIDAQGRLASIEADLVPAGPPAERPRRPSPLATPAAPAPSLPRTGAPSRTLAPGGAVVLGAGLLLAAWARLLGARRRGRVPGDASRIRG